MTTWGEPDWVAYKAEDNNDEINTVNNDVLLLDKGRDLSEELVWLEDGDYENMTMRKYNNNQTG